MVTYTVHERNETSGSLAERADAVTFVYDGFAWLALVFPILWLLYHRMWLVLVGLVVVFAAMQGVLLLAGLADQVQGWAVVGVSILFAFQANDLRRWSLARKGFRFAGPVSGANRAACEARFFELWLAAQAELKPGRTAYGKPPAAAGKAGRKGDDGDEVIGLFPEAGG